MLDDSGILPERKAYFRTSRELFAIGYDVIRNLSIIVSVLVRLTGVSKYVGTGLCIDASIPAIL